jgi:hypothetical protein
MIETGQNSLFFHQPCDNPTSSYLVAKQEELAKEIMRAAEFYRL